MSSESASTAPYQALRHAVYRRMALAQLVSLVGTQMQVAAIEWHIYLLTGSPVALGGIGLTRVIPIIVFSLWGGIVADRYDRKKILFLAESVMALAAAALAAATFAHLDAVWLIYLATAIAASASAFANPARQALIPRLVPTADLQGALSLNLTAFNFATIAGPALAGLLLAGTARGHLAGRGYLGWIYLINAASFLAVLAVLLTIRTSMQPEQRGGERVPFFAALREGLRFVWSQPILVWTSLLDFFATFFAGSLSLLPIVADQILHVGPQGFGLLRAAPAIGATLGTIYTSLRSLPRRVGPVLLVSVALYGAATIAVGLSRVYWLTFVALAFTGLADAISTVVRHTVRQLVTPDAMRGRMTSITMIFFMGGPQLGELEAGLVAGIFASAATGAMVSIVSGGVATLLAVVLIARLAPLVRDFELGRD